MQEEKVYEIDNKKYTVISKVIEDSKSIEDLYDLVTEYVLERLNEAES